MSIDIIQHRLEEYACRSTQEEERALREITQEIALAGLSRSGFFKHAAFQGGTCLRILYGLDRFSEDLDFILQAPNADFHWETHLKNLALEFQVYGIEIETTDRSKLDESIRKAFIKEDSLGKLLTLKHPQRSGRPKKIRVKLELDVNPPAGSDIEMKYLDFPIDFPVTVQDLPSLFGGKCHALLCREYVKGRDWYDFLWYVRRKTPLNFVFFANTIEQQGPWAGQGIAMTKTWFLQAMEEKITAIDWPSATADVARFLKPHEQESLALWSRAFFLDRLHKVADYLEAG